MRFLVIAVWVCAGLGLITAAVFIAAIRLSVGVSPNPRPVWFGEPDATLGRVLEKHCTPMMAKGRCIGLVAAVVRGTNAAVAGLGKMALHGAAVGPETIFEVGSISKTFTGIALATQVSRGRMQLEDPVARHLPNQVKLPEAAQGITLKQLATHSSGLPRLPEDRSLLGPICMVLFGSDPYSFTSEAKFMESLRGIQLQFQPGTKSEYSNLGAGLLGYALANESRTNYDAFIRREVCLPLGMNRSGVALSRTDKSRLAQGYRWVRRIGPLTFALRSAPWNLADYYAGAGGIHSTPTDMMKYLRANMRPHTTKLAEPLALSHRAAFQEDDNTAYGLNWVRSKWPWAKGQTIIWHNGGTGGFRSFIGFSEESALGVLVLCNAGPGDISDILAISMLKDMLAGG